MLANLFILLCLIAIFVIVGAFLVHRFAPGSKLDLWLERAYAWLSDPTGNSR